jgi:lipoprotein-anchoring transpeptidase ErfK/SrfK
MNNAELLQAQKAIRTARDYLRSGDRSAARRWAEQAAELAPQLEDPWLILAAVASPRASVAFIERALQINPNSPRARKGMQWALKRLQQAPPASGGEVPSRKKAPVRQKQTQKAKRSAAPKKVGQRAFIPILLLALGCVVVISAAWFASTTPVLASILNGGSQPAQAAHPQVWARVEIAKPSSASESKSEVAESNPALSPPTSEPMLAVTGSDPTQPPPTPTLPPPTLEPTAVPTLAPPTSTSEPSPTVTPEATSTPAGELAMEILEDTPEPTPRPASERAVDPPVGNGVRWIEVNLSEQRVYAWEGDVLMNSFVVSTGTWATPTVTGTFKIWNKTRIQTMSGPGYSLPNVPWVMYFYKDYGFHGTYWHNNFGTPMSHGCVNLTIPAAQWLYNWASYGTTVKVHY